MADELKYSKLEGATGSWQKMIQRFGVVTVMNVKVYDTSKFEVIGTSETTGWDHKQADAILAEISAATELCTLDTLKIANVTMEGPNKTVSGGQYNYPLIRFGKSVRLEMQDALGNVTAIDALCGGIAEGSGADTYRTTTAYALHFGENFERPKTLVGDTFFINQSTGQQVQAKIIFYQFLPDSLFNLTQDAEGDATVFDMNGDLLTTNILISDTTGTGTVSQGVFYSILDPMFDPKK